jgi:murein hydrolase activator
MSPLKSPIKILLLCCFVGLIGNAFAAKKIDVAKEDLSDLHEKIQALKKELDSNQAAHKDASDELKQSETAISAANKKLHEIKQKQAQNTSTLSQLKKQSVHINGSLAEQQKQLSAQLYQQYTHGGQSYAQLVLQSKDPSNVARELKYFSYIAKERAKLIDDMQGSLVKVKKLNNQTKATLLQVADLKAKQETEKKELEVQKKEKSKVVKNLSQQIAAQRGEIKKLKRDEQSLSNLVERLARIIPPPPKKKHKTTGKYRPKSKDNKPDNIDETPSENTTVASNETLPSNDFEGSNFASLRGKLRLPVRGDVSNRFGAARADTGISWKGLFIRAAEGNAVKAVATGRVVFADWMRGFGNLIIVDHGDGYMSLYGNNQALLKSVGDGVSGGDSIASVGNSGGNESNGLYYELRRQSKPFDPMSWSVH